MSSAHRPTWTPAMGKDARLNTKQYSSRDIAGHTKLKFRQPGQGTQSEIARRDLKLELELAERESRMKKRKMEGLLPLNEDSEKQPQKLIDSNGDSVGDERSNRLKLLEQAILADKDDSDSEEEDDEDQEDLKRKQQHKNGHTNGNHTNDQQAQDDEDDSEDDEDSDDDESETAELMKELEKIKRERAEEKERQERESTTAAALDKETEAATGNPLLNLKAALNHSNGNLSPTNSVSTSTTSFAVKRRWDDDVIFKNQARDVNEKPKKEFVNDLLRTEFHRRFLKKFIA